MRWCDPLGDRAGGLSRPLRRRPRVVSILLHAMLVIVIVTAALNAYVVVGASGKATGEIAEVPRSQAAIVLGAAVHEDGEPSAMLSDRLNQAARLWHAGKVDRILVSGDHGAWAYDEPGNMRQALQELGVAAGVIFTDHAGFDTWPAWSGRVRCSACRAR